MIQGNKKELSWQYKEVQNYPDALMYGAGQIQNFIGPNNKIEDTSYVPISSNEIHSYMENLEFFINGENHQSFENEKDAPKEYFEYDSFPY